MNANKWKLGFIIIILYSFLSGFEKLLNVSIHSVFGFWFAFLKWFVPGWGLLKTALNSVLKELKLELEFSLLSIDFLGLFGHACMEVYDLHLTKVSTLFPDWVKQFLSSDSKVVTSCF